MTQYYAVLESDQLEALRSSANDGPNRVAAAIRLAGLTQRSVAVALDITEPHLSNVCRGHVKDVSLPTARKLAEFLGCSIEDLFPSRVA
ncbi:MAG: helix-turn-helix transcriptional regulator [Acidobacteriota bacterium]|nr:helix-turn-helix transcriptional regulator [Acidobacteriota bacterium]